MSATAFVPEARSGFVDVLSADEVASAVAGVDAEVARWARRDMPPVDFFTLGAASYLDAVADLAGYYERSAETNPALLARFGWLYERVAECLAGVMGACGLCDPLAYPGFHIFGHRPGQVNNGFTRRAMQGLTASVHSDRQFEPHGAVWARFGDVDLAHTLTFTLALRLPRAGAGLCLWDGAADGAADDASPDESPYCAYVRRTFDFKSLKGLDPPRVIPYHEGRLFYFFGLARHVIAPSWTIDDDDRRITLQGHGVRCDGVWRLYF